MLDADISDFFAKLDHAWLEKFLEHRIADKRVLRLIRKWLSAGVMEDGKWSRTEGITAGSADIAAACEHLPPLHLRPWVQRWRLGMLVATSSSSDMPMTSSSDLSIMRKRAVGPNSVHGSRSSDWSCTLRRHG